MATITKRKAGYFVQVRRKGYEPEYRTFKTKAEAQSWARERESRIDRGDQPSKSRELRSITLGDIVDRYLQEVTPRKLGADAERLRLGKMRRAEVCRLSLYDLSSAAIAAYRDTRAKEVKPATVTREMNLLHRIVEVARTDWGLALHENPVSRVRRLPAKNSRDRRLRDGELQRLLNGLAKLRNTTIKPVILFAIETALRRGEILQITWDCVDLRNRTLHIPHTKTGHPRTIPLTDAAVAVLEGQKKEEQKVFPLTADALRLAWSRVRMKAGVPDLRFHDLRHEAISRFAEMGLSTVELAAISGHRDLRMLARYTHIQPSALARKLAGRSWEREVGSL